MPVNRRPIKAMHYEDRLALIAKAALVQGQRIVYVQRQPDSRPIAASEKRNLMKMTQQTFNRTEIHS